MNDPAMFGMAKSIIMKGRDAGFDMSDEEEMGKFIELYNASMKSGATPGGLFDAPRTMRAERGGQPQPGPGNS